jgi:hypothetical protein
MRGEFEIVLLPFQLGAFFIQLAYGFDLVGDDKALILDLFLQLRNFNLFFA